MDDTTTAIIPSVILVIGSTRLNMRACHRARSVKFRRTIANLPEEALEYRPHARKF